jgi:hypothetical protein
VAPPSVAALGWVEEYEITWLALIEPLSVAVAGAASLEVAFAVSLNDPGVPEVVNVTLMAGSAVPAVRADELA